MPRGSCVEEVQLIAASSVRAAGSGYLSYDVEVLISCYGTDIKTATR